MHLLFVNANRSAAFGGVERWMIDTAVGLAGRGCTATLVGRPGAHWLDAGARAGVRVRGSIHGTWAQRVLRVLAVMRAERPDLVIAKGTKVARWATWGRAAGLGGRVILYFGLTEELDPKRWIDRFTWRSVDAAIITARDAARWYAEHGFGPAEKLHALWRGVDLAKFTAADGRRAAMRATLGLGDDAVAVCMVGRLAWQKGIDDLLAAARDVIARVPQARFFVIGGGRDADAVAAAVRVPALRGAVTLLGHRDDVPTLLAAADVFVQSSRREVMAQTTLEAMAAGCAVVSTRTMGAAEAIDDGRTGLLVPVGDVRAIADAIVTLATDPARRAAMGEAARARVAADFTAAAARDRAAAIFRTVASRSRAGVAALGGVAGRAVEGSRFVEHDAHRDSRQ